MYKIKKFIIGLFYIEYTYISEKYNTTKLKYIYTPNIQR